MDKETRHKLLELIAKELSISFQEATNAVLRDELMYVGLKAAIEGLDIKAEFSKVLDIYNFEGFTPSNLAIKYIEHFSMNPKVAAMQHVDLNDYVSYIGEYYDGTPTIKYRKEDRYKVEPIKIN